ncbi:AraC family transcriptional regulator [Rhodococcus sp. Q]|uniref:AraC family transcriptional regulator n=1 Tax=Rhodococcus sp. Q TaxID=2502252 RepID=UPI0010F67A12|nr:AraC family transcriptional regulator [Rhodococcus sp. Q]
MIPGAVVRRELSPAAPAVTEASNRVIAAITDPWDHPRTMVSVALMCEWGASHGIEVETLLRGTRIDAGSLNDPEGLVGARQEMAVIRNLVTAIGHRPGLGVELGSLYHLTAYGYLGYLLTASATARDTVERGLHFALLTFAFTTMTARIDSGGRYVLTLEADDVPEDVRGFVLERDTAAVVQIHREIFPGAGRVPLREIRLATGNEGSTGVFADFFQVPVVFGCPDTEVVLDAGYLDEVPPMANTHTAQLLVAQCERIRAERLHHTGVAARVRAHLLDRTSLDLTLEDVALQLHYAPRTLRRHLEHEGTTFRELLDEVRRSVAENLLLDRSMSRHEIARRLGYQDWSSVVRATRRWKRE